MARQKLPIYSIYGPKYQGVTFEFDYEYLILSLEITNRVLVCLSLAWAMQLGEETGFSIKLFAKSDIFGQSTGDMSEE